VTQETVVVVVLVLAAALVAGMMWPEQYHQSPEWITDSVAYDPGQSQRRAIQGPQVIRGDRVSAGALAEGQPGQSGAGASSVATAALLCCTAFALSRLLWSLGSRRTDAERQHDLVMADRFSDWQ